MVLVVGPSGAGKDAILGAVRARLANDPTTHFPRRVISRPAHASEEFISSTPTAFEAAERAGDFAVAWRSHGLAYGIGIEIDANIRAGDTVVFNTSRSAVAGLRKRYARVHVVLIDAPPELRARRLVERGRETGGDVAARLQRAPDDFTAGDADAVIVNDTDLESAVAAFMTHIQTSR